MMSELVHFQRERIGPRLKAAVRTGWFYALALLLVMLVAYALQITRLGFYWDDWQAVYLARFDDPGVYWPYYLSDRPLSVWTYLLTFPILGEYPLAWQFFTLLVRWAGLLALCAALANVWPDRIWQVRWAGILLAVFPGFSQQAIAVAYSQHFITFLLFALSLWFMTLAVRRPARAWPYTLAGVVLSLAHMLTMEYFVGLEWLRPVFLWIMLRDPLDHIRQTARRTAYRWLPYLLMLVAFAAYRLVFFSIISPGGDENAPFLLQTWFSDPIGVTLQLTQSGIEDFLHVTLQVWAETVEPEDVSLGSPPFFIAWMVSLGVALLLIRYNRLGGPYRQQDRAVNRIFHLQGLVIGLLAFILGAMPVLLTDRQIIVGKWSDRFALAPMIGGVFLVVVFIDWLSDSKDRKGIVFSLLAALALVSLIQNANHYRRYWDIQRDFYRQLAWRVPALEPGTAVIGSEMPFDLAADYSIGYALNLIYGLPDDPARPQYWFIDAGRYQGRAPIPAIEPDTPMEFSIRSVTFTGNTSQAIAVGYDGLGRCLRVLDLPYRDAPPLKEGDLILWPVAGVDEILAEGSGQLPSDIFGREPEPGWCYYFQKADLARQFEQWDVVIALYAEAAQHGLQARDPVEMTPLLEAYVALSRWEEAVLQSEQLSEQDAELAPLLCELWDRVEEDGRAPADVLEYMRTRLNCGQN